MIAKRTLYIDNKELEKLFNLPEGVEILSVKSVDYGFEFLLVSAEEVEGVTIKQDGAGLFRRLTMRALRESNDSKETTEFNNLPPEIVKSFNDKIRPEGIIIKEGFSNDTRTSL